MGIPERPVGAREEFTHQQHRLCRNVPRAAVTDSPAHYLLSYYTSSISGIHIRTCIAAT